MPGVYKYALLTLTELRELDPRNVICLITVSPLEVHGPHLPLGTDVLVGEKLQEEYCRALGERYPGYNLLLLPPVYAGCDPLPVGGSIAVRARTLEGLLGEYVRALAGQGFRYLIVCDNHGGPSHQLALEVVARRAWRRYGFAVISPFNVVFLKMVRQDPEFLELTGLGPGECGDDADSHAGTNETSLVLAISPDLAGGYRDVPLGYLPPRRGAAAMVGRLGSGLGRLGLKEVAADLDHLANILAWTGDPNMRPYLGAPARATREAGERMIRGHVAVLLDLVNRALAGERPLTTPMFWWVRFFRW